MCNAGHLFIEVLRVSPEDRFEVEVLGPSEVDLEEGSFHSFLCQLNRNSSNIVWMFNGSAVQVCIECVQTIFFL